MEKTELKKLQLCYGDIAKLIGRWENVLESTFNNKDKCRGVGRYGWAVLLKGGPQKIRFYVLTM